MRCQICNTILTDDEELEKIPGTNEFLDECSVCTGNLFNDVDELLGENHGDYE